MDHVANGKLLQLGGRLETQVQYFKTEIDGFNRDKSRNSVMRFSKIIDTLNRLSDESDELLLS